MPERLGRRVEHHGQMGRLFPGDEFQQVFGEPVENGGILSLRIDHRPAQEGVVHPENEGMPVNQVQCIHNLQI